MHARFVVPIGLVVLLSIAAAAAPLGTEFTYQGELKLNGGPVGGSTDMKFSLWNAATNGAQVGPTLTFDGVGGNPAPVQVVLSLFTVALNFGPAPYNGDALWLDIQVRFPSGVGNYVPLTPRQKLTAAPYALYALSSPGSGLWTNSGSVTHNTVTGFVGINRAAAVTGNEYFGIQAPVNSGYGGMYIRTDGANGLPFYGYSAGGAKTAWTYLDGATGDWHLYNNGSTRFTVTDTGDVGIGTTSPGAKLDVTTTTGDGINASTSAAFSVGVYGSGTTAGVQGVSGASNGSGVYGIDDTTGGTGTRGDAGGNGGAGVAGYGNFGAGVYGQSLGGGNGIEGSNGNSNTVGYAGYFNGRVHVNGTLSKNAGSFRIDHPLDPANKYLNHSFVESPDMMNVYNGNVTLDAQGEAVVQMPDWFETLNKDFRYQLTCIGGFAPLFVADEIHDNQFRIAGGTAGLKVSWQVTGVRHDPYADAHRIVVEEEKPGAERGKYLHPELYGLPLNQGLYGLNRAVQNAEK
jgi:hypothetical protein